FVNGLAIVSFMAQLHHFKQAGADGSLQWLHGSAMFVMLGLVALSMAIIYLLPRLTRAVPSALAAIIIVALLTQVAGIHT
ncbi:sodium-independent anion transporter, partial [Staphylococcus pseudintermedius]